MTVRDTGLCRIGLAAAAAAALHAVPARAADLIDGFIFDNQAYSQTSNAAPTGAPLDFFDIGAGFATPGDYIAGSATYPGPASPQTLAPDGTTQLSFNSGFYPTLATLHAAYPFGAYTITATGPAGAETSMLSYTADAFSAPIPYVSDFSGLAGLDPAAAFTVTFPAFTPAATASEGYVFFTITNTVTGATVFDDGLLAPSTTSLIIPAGTLAANTAYTFELDDSDRIDGTDAADGTFTLQGFEVRTAGGFTTGAVGTAVPEPTSLAILVAGLWGLRLVRRRPAA